MSTTAATIRAGLLAAFASINGTGDYTYDLSATGQVVLGNYTTPPGTGKPGAMLTDWRISSEHGPQLGRYERRPVYRFVMFAPVTSDTVSVRMTACENLASDACIALERSVRSTGGSLEGIALDIIVRDIDPIESAAGDGYAGWATVVIQVEVYYRVNPTGGI